MHSERTIRTVEQLGRQGTRLLGWLGVAAGVAIVPELTPLAADIGLGVLGTAAVGTSLWAWSVRRQLAKLPLELAPVVSRRKVDGRWVYGTRARLGRGRALHTPQVQVTWEPQAGSPVALRTEVVVDRLVGPFTALAHDERQAVQGPGQFRLSIEVSSGGQRWAAEATVPADAIRDGQFGLDEAWSTVEPPPSS